MRTSREIKKLSSPPRDGHEFHEWQLGLANENEEDVLRVVAVTTEKENYLKKIEKRLNSPSDWIQLTPVEEEEDKITFWRFALKSLK